MSASGFVSASAPEWKALKDELIRLGLSPTTGWGELALRWEKNGIVKWRIITDGLTPKEERKYALDKG